MIDDLRVSLAEIFASDTFADATLSRDGAAVYDPRQRKTVPGTTENLPCRAVVGTVTRRDAGGAIVSATEITLSVEARTGDKLTIGPASYRIDAVRSEAPHGVPLIWFASVE